MIMETPRLAVLVVSGGYPRHRQETEAADVVLFEMLRFLAEDGRFAVTLLPVGRTDRTMAEPLPEAQELLSTLGVRFLDPVILEPNRPCRLDLAKAAAGLGGEALIQGAGQGRALLPDVERVRPDVVLSVWNEFANAAAAGLDRPVVAYYGDAEPVVWRALTELDRMSGAVSRLTELKRRLILSAVERAHLRLMRRLAAVTTVSANIADYYRRHGVKATYVRNMWKAGSETDWRRRRAESERFGPLRILGSLGSLRQTGNAYGLEILGRDVVPALRRRLPPGSFEIHVYGGGRPYRHVAAALEQPEIRLRGFVDDIDEEILSCPVFLIPNNHGWFRVGHTRFLHAWSLGACVVTFRGSVETMPEIVHGENALVADTPDEMAEMIARAAGDAGLRRKIGEGGQRTLDELFHPKLVCKAVADRLAAAVHGKESA